MVSHRQSRWIWIGAFAGAAAFPVSFACSPSSSTGTFTTSSGSGGTGAGPTTGGSGTGGDSFIDSGPPVTPVTISPQLPTMKVELPLTDVGISTYYVIAPRV